MRFSISFVFSLFVSISLFAQGNIIQSSGKIILSPLESVHVQESNAYWKAKIDGNQARTVINANSIAVMNASFPKEKNVTKNISFKLKNGDGNGRTVNTTVTGVEEYNGKKLYTAELELGINLSTKWEYRKVSCILADLEESEFKLLVGKDWLGEDIIVK